MKMKCGKALLTVCLAGALATGGLMAPIAAYAEPSDQLQQRVNEAYEQLQQYTMELELANGQLQTVKDDLEKIKSDIAQTESDIAEKKQEVEAGQKVISERLSQSYKQGNANLLSVVLGASNFDELFSRIFYATKMADYDAGIVEQTKSAMAELQKKQDELAKQQKEQEQLVSDQEAKTAEVNTRVNEQQSYYSGLDTELKNQLAEEAARKAAEEAAAKAAAEEAARQQQEAANQQQNAQTNGGGNNGNAGGDGGQQGTTHTQNTNTPVHNNPAPSKTEPAKPSKPSYSNNSGNAPASVVSIATAQVGKPYVWAAGGPNAFDCSGLTSYAYRQAGYSIPHSSQDQYSLVARKGHLVKSTSQLKPGDLVFWGRGGSGSQIYHVGMYIGGGQYVHASMPGVGVVISSLSSGGNYVGGGSPV